MVSPVTPSSSDRSDFTFKVEKEGEDDITLEFGKVGGKDEISFSVAEDIPGISDTDENLMKILEDALKEAGIEDPQQGKDKIKSVKAHFEKEKGNIVAETYIGKKEEMIVDRNGNIFHGERAFWKFKMTWKIEVEGSKTPIERTVWMKTPQKIPKDMSNPKEYEHSKHLALLYVKAQRHVHKAALDPKHADYEKAKNKIEFLRSHNQIKMAFKTSAWVGSTNALDRAFSGNFRIREGEYTQWAEIKLQDDVPAKTLFEKIVKKIKGSEYFSIDYIARGDKTKYGHAGMGVKYIQQASEIIVKDERLQAFEELSKTSKTDFIDKFKNYTNESNDLSKMYGRIDVLSYVMRANGETSERREKMKKTNKALSKPILANLGNNVERLKTAMVNFRKVSNASEDVKVLKAELQKEYDQLNSIKNALDDIKKMKEFIALKKDQVDKLVEEYDNLKSSDKENKEKDTMGIFEKIINFDEKDTLKIFANDINANNEDAKNDLSAKKYENLKFEEVKTTLEAAKNMIDASISGS